MNPATDLDVLIARGFGEAEAKSALQQTRGDIDLAVRLLARGESEGADWAQETRGEWKDSVSINGISNSSGRALRKSSFYFR